MQMKAVLKCLNSINLISMFPAAASVNLSSFSHRLQLCHEFNTLNFACRQGSTPGRTLGWDEIYGRPVATVGN